MPVASRKIKFFSLRNIHQLPQYHKLSTEQQFALRVVGTVLPFRVNNYIADELIDWDNIPDDPIYQLTFLQKDMLLPNHFNRLASLLKKGASAEEICEVTQNIRLMLNPHPAGQLSMNVPKLNDEPVQGLQHKYRETCLVFPSNGQTCHSYCSFCFRWPQFVAMDDLQFATDESKRFQEYLRVHHEITDVLFTGGDPMVMSVRNLEKYLLPLLEPEFEHIQTIRIGTKSVAYWPYRYVSDKDSDDVLRLFERIVRAGKHLAIMAHYNHWREMSTPIAQEAIQRIRATGAQIRTQSPLIRRINDRPEVWAKMWRMQVRLGCVPYYMFVERDTGAHHYFSVSLYQAWKIFQAAYTRVSGLARTVRGPSMSAWPGKVAVEGVAKIHNEKVFVLTFLQARRSELCKRPFFAAFDPEATWLDDLRPAFGEKQFPFERVLQDAGIRKFPEAQTRRRQKKFGAFLAN